MNLKRCINCGISLDKSASIKCCSFVQNGNLLGIKLKNWLKPSATKIGASSLICHSCIKIVKVSENRAFLNQTICLGCGAVVQDGSSTKLAGEELMVCRSWVGCEIAVRHLTEVCKVCYERLQLLRNNTRKTAKIAPEFVCVDPLNILNLQPENVELGPSGLQLEDNVIIIKEELQNFEDNVLDTSIEENKNNNSRRKSNERSCNDDSNNGNDNCLVEDETTIDIKEEICSDDDSNDYVSSNTKYTKYDYLEESNESEEESSDKTEDETSDDSEGYKDDTKDKDYNPTLLKEIKVAKRKRESIIKTRSAIVDKKSESEEKKVKKLISKNQLNSSCVELQRYTRTSRLGCCVFKNCIETCVSYVPRVVRRRMFLEYNMYISPLSQVCEEHLTDQNWEDLLPESTSKFTAKYCQEMKNFATKACWTNFDFENIETVDSKLVRYWFDLNKSDFNRIFNCFPKLKLLKKPKTAFAVYLMYLQNTSLKRISLLLEMSEKAVKKRVFFVRDIVQCNSYERLKEKFLEDD